MGVSLVTREAAAWRRRDRAATCTTCTAVRGQPCHGQNGRAHPARLIVTIFGGAP
jgi:hypothetical protein